MPSTNLIDGLQALSLDSTPRTVEALEQYVNLLEKWNAVINLTAIRERERMITWHLLDSLTVMPWVSTGQRLLDVGSGGGLPGIPLAIMAPQMAVTLLEPNQKKAAFLRQVKLELRLENVHIETQRVEQWQPEQETFDRIISRAFSDLLEFTKASEHLLSPQGTWIAMKGALPYEEISKLPTHLQAECLRVQIPGVQAERHVIVLQPTTSSPRAMKQPETAFPAPEGTGTAAIQNGAEHLSL